MAAESINVNNREGFSSEVKVSSNVIATVAAVAATEVDGIVALQERGFTRDIIGKFGIPNTSKGVNVTFDEAGKTAYISLDAVIKYGYSIMDVCKAVQDKVKSAVESMAGVAVDSVNINVAEVEMATTN